MLPFEDSISRDAACTQPEACLLLISGYADRPVGGTLPAYAPSFHPRGSGYQYGASSLAPGRSRPDLCLHLSRRRPDGSMPSATLSAALYQRPHPPIAASISTGSIAGIRCSPTIERIAWSQFECSRPSRPMFRPIANGGRLLMVRSPSEKTFQGDEGDRASELIGDIGSQPMPTAEQLSRLMQGF